VTVTDASAASPDLQGEGIVEKRVAERVGPRSVSATRSAFVRRVVNVIVAVVLLLVTAPIWVLIAILIRVTSRGPVVYTQTRVGIDTRSPLGRTSHERRRRDVGGRPFKIYKFRTMKVGAEGDTGPVWASDDDPRVTAVGRILRLYRLDELPQLINVLKGDMNVVGPRPERPAIIETLREEIPVYLQRQKTLPGITGRAQVTLRYDSSLEDVRKKVEHDIEYVQEASWWVDLKIMIATVPVMLFRRGSR